MGSRGAPGKGYQGRQRMCMCAGARGLRQALKQVSRLQREGWSHFIASQGFPLRKCRGGACCGAERATRGCGLRQPSLVHGQRLHRASAGGSCTLDNGFSSPAGAADKALGVVGPPQGRDDLSGDEVPTTVTAGPVELLVVVGADVLLVLKEEARLGQVAAAHCGGRTGPVKGAAGRSSPRAGWDLPAHLCCLSSSSPRASLKTQLSAGISEGFPSHQMRWGLPPTPQDVSVGLWRGAGWGCPSSQGWALPEAAGKRTPAAPTHHSQTAQEDLWHPLLDSQHLDGAQPLHLTHSLVSGSQEQDCKELGMP